MRVVIAVALKLVVTLVLATLVGGIVAAIFRLWSPSKTSVSAFEFRRESESVAEGGKAFALSVVRDLKGLYRTLFDDSGGGMVLPSLDQRGRGAAIDLPIAKASGAEEVEFEAYGVKISSLVKTLQKWIDPPDEISGSVTQTKDTVDVFAEMRSPAVSGDGAAYWHVTEGNVKEASYGLAARILVFLASQKEKGLRGVGDADFIAFMRALDSYQSYRRALENAGGAADPKVFLARADTLVGNLVRSSTNLPYAYKLWGYVLRENGRIADARAALKTYLEIIKSRHLDPDLGAQTALASLDLPANPTVAIAQTVAGTSLPRLRPGVSIGSGDKSITASLGLVVIDSHSGERSLLSASYSLGKIGDEVFQPAPVDGDGIPVARVVESSGAIGLARLKSGVGWSSSVGGTHLASIGSLESVSPGQDVRFVGRTSGLSAAKITAVAMTVRLNDGTKDVVYSDLIEIEPGSRPGDGGGPVFTERGEVIGIIFAGSGSRSLVAPIADLVKAKNLKIAPDS